jgi:tetratricopeptide (TPR) repeat protein
MVIVNLKFVLATNIIKGEFMIKRILVIIYFALIPYLVGAQEILTSPINISVSINESGNTILYRGWPILVSVIFFNENAYQENVAVKLSPDWESKFQFIIKNSSSEIVSLPFHLVDSPGENIILDTTTFVELGFWLDAEETNQIPIGDYELIGILDSTAYPELGSSYLNAVSLVHKIKIKDEPSLPSKEQRIEKDLLFANLNILRKDDEKALEYLNYILGYNPNNLQAILLTGQLLEDQGDYGSAMFAYSKAVDIFFAANPDPQEPPFQLLRVQNALAYKLDNSQSFNITLADKDTNHPFFRLGSPSCFYIDNIPFRELQLKRGVTYTFYLKNISKDNPFYFSTNIRGGGLEPYTEGVTGAPADSNNIITFTVPLNAPDSLYYQSYTNEFAGWRINITDSAGITSIKENIGTPNRYFISLAYPNPFNPKTNIRVTVSKSQHILIKVYNIIGEQLKILFEGNIQANKTHNFEFNGANLASGIYLITVKGDNIYETRKVILLK